MAGKHTPGPWEIGHYEWDIVAEDGVAVAQVCANNADFKANARLIAKAPDMKAALEEILVSIQQHIERHGDRDGGRLVALMKLADEALPKDKGP